MSSYLSLIVNNMHCRLPEADNDYFTFEGPEGENIAEGVMRLPFRRFIPSHPQSEEFLEILGEENTLIFYRVLLSHYDAAYMLYDFTRRYIRGFSTISLSAIEKEAEEYDIDLFNYKSVDKSTYLAVVDGDRDFHKEEFHPPTNDVQELLWAMNLEKILKNYGISYYPDKNFTEEERNTGNFNLLIYKMLKSREVSMVMHTWRKLNSYDRTDYLGNVSNLLEFIIKDWELNPETFNSSMPEFQSLKDLHALVKNSKRPVYFGLFNSAKLLGFISRHGSQLIDYDKLSESNVLDIETIRANMANKIIPNQQEIHHMFNVWHLTTSLAVSLWFRLKIVK